jgi:hypothetical protein
LHHQRQIAILVTYFLPFAFSFSFSFSFLCEVYLLGLA